MPIPTKKTAIRTGFSAAGLFFEKEKVVEKEPGRAGSDYRAIYEAQKALEAYYKKYAHFAKETHGCMTVR